MFRSQTSRRPISVSHGSCASMMRHLVDDERREPAGGDHRHRRRVLGRQLGRHPPRDPLDLPGEPVHDPGLQRLDRVLADHPRRPGQLDLQQLRGAPGQRVDGDLDPGRERPADELAAAR